MELGLVRIIALLARKLCAVEAPLRTFDRLQRQPRFAQQAARDRRLAMNELGAALGSIAELRRRQRLNAPAAALTRLQDRHPLPGAREFAGGDEAGRAGA